MLRRSAGQSCRGIGIAPPYSELLSWCHHEDVGMGSSAGLGLTERAAWAQELEQGQL